MEIGEVIKQTAFSSPAHKAKINLLYTYHWMRDQYRPVFKKHGILEQHYNVLRIVNGKDPEPAYPSHIISVMIDKKRDLTRLVDKLVKKGLLSRGSCESNRRRVEIFITEAGKALIDEVAQDMAKVDGKLNYLTDEEAEQLSVLLDKWRG
jgi:DNA-binding MarR family transcriptional regulator